MTQTPLRDPRKEREICLDLLIEGIEEYKQGHHQTARVIIGLAYYGYKKLGDTFNQNVARGWYRTNAEKWGNPQKAPWE